MSTRSSGTEPRPQATAQRIHVAGSCHAGRDVAIRLSNDGHAVHLHDPEPPRDLPDGLAINEVDAFDARTLAELDLDDETTLLAVTPSDSTNLLIAQVAKTLGVQRIVATVRDPRRIPAFEAAGIETVDAAAVLGQDIAERV